MFTTKNNPTGRFVAAFVTQFVGLISATILYTVSGISENLVTDPQMKTITAVLPYLISVIIFLTIRGIYEVEYFDEKRFFNSK